MLGQLQELRQFAREVLAILKEIRDLLKERTTQ